MRLSEFDCFYNPTKLEKNHGFQINLLKIILFRTIFKETMMGKIAGNLFFRFIFV
jgi:hypothetical protein